MGKYDRTLTGVTIAGLAFAQNTSFTMVSRARNRDNTAYHVICSLFSNSIWLATFGLLGAEIIINSNYLMAIPYITGTVAGSLFGAKASIKIERIIGAST